LAACAASMPRLSSQASSISVSASLSAQNLANLAACSAQAASTGFVSAGAKAGGDGLVFCLKIAEFCP